MALITFNFAVESDCLFFVISKFNFVIELIVSLMPDFNGKLIVTNCHILHAFDVKCEGDWPKQKDNTFQCYIDPKDIARLAGNNISVVVYDCAIGGNRKQITLCEIDYMRSECIGLGKYPDWQRVIPQHNPHTINIISKEINPLLKWLRSNMGKTKSEHENRIVKINAKPNILDISTGTMEYDTNEGNNVFRPISETSVVIDKWPSDVFEMYFNAELFYYAILPDFNGKIELSEPKRPVKFSGPMRQQFLCHL